MSGAHVLLSVFEFAFTVVLSVLVVYVNYQIFNRANPDYDEEEEIKKGNMGVAILSAAILFASALIIKNAIFPVVSLVRLYLTSPMSDSLTKAQLALYAVSHLVMAFVVSVLTISFTLRMFGRLTKNIEEGKELRKGNPAVGVMLASVVLIVALFVSEGVSSLSKALIPQPSIGRVKVLR